jgi:hypothetical protein
MNTETSTVTSNSLIKGFIKENSRGGLGVDNVSVDESGKATFRGQNGEKINFLEDDKKEMTWGRRIALSLMDKTWYNPRAGEAGDPPPEAPAVAETVAETVTGERGTSERKVLEKPSLAKAWAYFEHVALDRHIVQPKTTTPTKNPCVRIIHKFQKGDKKLEKAEPGHNSTKTSLYSPIFTPHTQVRYQAVPYFHCLRFLSQSHIIVMVGACHFSLEISDLVSDCTSPRCGPLLSSLSLQA